MASPESDRVKWFAVYEEATGRLVSTGTVVADDEILAEKGLVKQECVGFDPQGHPDGDPDGRYEWDEAQRRHVSRSGAEMRQKRLATLRAREDEIEAEMRTRGERVPARTPRA